MPRSVNSAASKHRRKRILKQAKGFWGRRKNVYTVAKNAVEKALQYAYTGRKLKKRDFRGLWIQRINAAVRQYDLSYSVFMSLLSKSKVDLNRKVLADLAMNEPKTFKAIVESVHKGGTKKAASTSSTSSSTGSEESSGSESSDASVAAEEKAPAVKPEKVAPASSKVTGDKPEDEKKEAVG